jgi:type I restriction enzyme, S subunit
MNYKKYTIGDLCTLVRGTSPTLKTHPGEYPMVVTASYRRTASSYQLEGPAVCVPLISSTGHGHAALHRVHYQEGRFALANLLVALRPRDPSVCYARYLYHLLTAKKDEYFVPLMLGTANVSLKEKDIAGVEISLPELSEQRRIVARIEELAVKVEEARDLRKQASDEAELILSSKIDEFIREGVSSKLWRLASLPDFVASDRHAIKRGPFGSHLRKEYFVPSGYKVYEQKHAIYGDFTDGTYYIDEAKFRDMKAFEVRPGDLIVSCSGTIGKVAIVPDSAAPGIINQALLKISLDSQRVDSEVFKIVFESTFIKDEIRAMSPGSAMKNIGSVKVLKKILFPLPPISKQRAFLDNVNRLRSKMDILHGLQRETSTELDALMPSILDKAFRGEL